MTHDDEMYVQSGDLVIMDKELLGKYAYLVQDAAFDHVRLNRVDLKEDEYLFVSYSELEEFIKSEPGVSWFPLNS